LNINHLWYLIDRIDIRIAENLEQVKHTPFNLFMRRADLHLKRIELLKLRERTYKSITTYINKQNIKTKAESNNLYWIATDNLGSGYDMRFGPITVMDTM